MNIKIVIITIMKNGMNINQMKSLNEMKLRFYGTIIYNAIV